MIVLLALLIIAAPISCALVLHWLNRTDREIKVVVELRLDGRVISETLATYRRKNGGRTC